MKKAVNDTSVTYATGEFADHAVPRAVSLLGAVLAVAN